MKKTILILSAMLGLLIANGACNKTKDEWNRFSGYQKEDIIGHYTANPDESVYVELPTEGVIIYRDVTINISPLSNNNVSLKISIPNVLNKIFTGGVALDVNDSEIRLYNQGTNEDILMTVYRNEMNQIRLSGRERKCYYAGDSLVDCKNYSFDVIKQNDNIN